MSLISSGTSADKIAGGTTAQRPTGEVGMMRFNTDTKRLEWWDGSAWVTSGITSDVNNANFTVTTGDQTTSHLIGGSKTMTTNQNTSETLNVEFDTDWADARYSGGGGGGGPVYADILNSVTFSVFGGGNSPSITLSSGISSVQLISSGRIRINFKTDARPHNSNYGVTYGWCNETGSSNGILKTCTQKWSYDPVLYKSTSGMDLGWGSEHQGVRGNRILSAHVYDFTS